MDGLAVQVAGWAATSVIGALVGAVVTVMPDGTISGEPGVLHYTNGHMFNISDNWYLEG